MLAGMSAFLQSYQSGIIIGLSIGFSLAAAALPGFLSSARHYYDDVKQPKSQPTWLKFALRLENVVVGLMFICFLLLQLVLGGTGIWTLFFGHDPWSFSVVIYSLLAAFFVSANLAFVYVTLEVKKIALSPLLRLAITLGGCVVALIGFFLPWFQYRYNPPPSLQVVNGVHVTLSQFVETGYTIAQSAHGNVEVLAANEFIENALTALLASSVLASIIALALIGVFRLIRNSVLIGIFGQSVHGVMSFLLLIYMLAFMVTGLQVTVFKFYFVDTLGNSPAAKQASQYIHIDVSYGLGLVILGFLILFVGYYWPDFKPVRSSTAARIGIVVATVVFGLVFFHFGESSLDRSIASLLGGGRVAVIIAQFIGGTFAPDFVILAIGAFRALYKYSE